MRSTTPVIILAGRLGAGKTTLLNHVLRHAGDRRFGVIVNDFGAVNVDALMVARQVDGVVGIGNGCVCCATDSDGFEDSVTRLVRTGVDAVLVEASGIADPRSMIRRVVAMADPIVAYGGLVYVVDAATGDAVLPREVLAHARVADLLVVNKADLVDAGCVTSIGDRLVAVNATAPRVITAEGALDPALLVDAAARADVAGPEQLTLDARRSGCRPGWPGTHPPRLRAVHLGVGWRGQPACGGPIAGTTACGVLSDQGVGAGRVGLLRRIARVLRCGRADPRGAAPGA